MYFAVFFSFPHFNPRMHSCCSHSQPLYWQYQGHGFDSQGMHNCLDVFLECNARKSVISLVSVRTLFLLIVIFSKDTLYKSKVTVKTFMMFLLQISAVLLNLLFIKDPESKCFTISKILSFLECSTLMIITIALCFLSPKSAYYHNFRRIMWHWRR